MSVFHLEDLPVFKCYEVIHIIWVYYITHGYEQYHIISVVGTVCVGIKLKLFQKYTK